MIKFHRHLFIFYFTFVKHLLGVGKENEHRGEVSKNEFNVATALPSTPSLGCQPPPCPMGSSVEHALNDSRKGFLYQSILLKLCCLHLEVSFPSPSLSWPLASSATPYLQIYFPFLPLPNLFHPDNLKSLNSFWHQPKSLKSKVPSKSNMGKTRGIICPEAKFLSSYEPVK